MEFFHCPWSSFFTEAIYMAEMWLSIHENAKMQFNEKLLRDYVFHRYVSQNIDHQAKNPLMKREQNEGNMLIQFFQKENVLASLLFSLLYLHTTVIL